MRQQFCRYHVWGSAAEQRTRPAGRAGGLHRTLARGRAVTLDRGGVSGDDKE